MLPSKPPFKTAAERDRERQLALDEDRKRHIAHAPWWCRADSLALWSGALLQAGLLALAIYGYKYTVIPIYQKERLSEEISEREIELAVQRREAKHLGEQMSGMTHTVDRLRSQRDRLEIQSADLLSQRAALESQRVKLQENVELLRTEALTARAVATDATRQLRSVSYERDRVEALRQFATVAPGVCAPPPAQAPVPGALGSCLRAMADADALIQKLDRDDRILLSEWIIRESERTEKNIGVETTRLEASSREFLEGLDPSASLPRGFRSSAFLSALGRWRLQGEIRSLIRELADRIAVRVHGHADPKTTPDVAEPKPPAALTIS